MLLFLISVYQKVFSPLLNQLLGTPAICRFSPTCSEYAKKSITQYGSIKGGYLSIIRLLECQPFGIHKKYVIPV